MEMRKQIMLQFCFVIGLIFITAQLPANNAAFVWPIKSAEGYLEDLPCSYLGTYMNHEDQLAIDACTTCTCSNSTLRCKTRSCPSIFCVEPIRFDDMCCDVCPHYVPVYEVKTTKLLISTEQTADNIIFDMTVKINGDGRRVAGEDLWKVGVWGSCNGDGQGERISYQEQVLTDEQAATLLYRPPFFGGFEFSIRDIAVSLDRTGESCSEMEFICFEISKGDNPILKDPRIPFTVEGVAGEDDLTPVPENLKGCVSKHMAESPKPCGYEENVFNHGEEVIIDECLTVSCDNGEVHENTKSCPPVICDSPVKFDGECCKSCSYSDPTDVPIYDVNARNLNNITEQEVNDVVFDLNLNINGAGTSIFGHGLWKLSVWSSGNADGEGQRISYQEQILQILTEEQAATELTRPDSIDIGFEFSIDNITYSLDGTNTTCSEMQFLCYEFNKEDSSNPKDTRLNFSVDGEQNITSAPQSLRGCTRFPKCREALTVLETDAYLIKGSVADDRTSNPYKINYNMIMGDDDSTIKEQGLWELTAYGSSNADGTGEKFNPTTETFDTRQASKKFRPGQFVHFGKIDFDISMQGQTCDTVKYVCFELGIGSNCTEHFTVKGIEEDTLRSCVRAFCDG